MATVRTHLIVSCATTLLMAASVYRRTAGDLELPNRIPEAAPYVTAEAESVPPPFEDFWQQLDHPAQCQTCHARVFNEWNGSMMANAWRDPVWRAAFLLSARETSTVKFDAKIVASFADEHLAQAVKIVGVSDDLNLVADCEKMAQRNLGKVVSAARSQPCSGGRRPRKAASAPAF